MDYQLSNADMLDALDVVSNFSTDVQCPLCGDMMPATKDVCDVCQEGTYELGSDTDTCEDDDDFDAELWKSQNPSGIETVCQRCLHTGANLDVDCNNCVNGVK